jgi:Dynein heavy chain C-terminal domain
MILVSLSFSPSLLPPSFSLLSQGFMTASLQTYAREHLEAIDNLSFAYKILSVPPEEIKVAPSDGVIVFGIYLEVQTHPRIWAICRTILCFYRYLQSFLSHTMYFMLSLYL